LLLFWLGVKPWARCFCDSCPGEPLASAILSEVTSTPNTLDDYNTDHSNWSNEAGGDLPIFVSDTAVMQQFLGPLIDALIGTQDDFDIIVPVFQTAVDASDPAAWGPHLINQRLDGSPAPDILLPVSLQDDDVPPAAGRALVRSIGLPHLMPVAEKVSLLEVIEGPLQGNLEEGNTGAYFQFDRVSSDNGVIESSHSNLPWSPEGELMTFHFFESYFNGHAEISEPYSALETSELQ
jgi:hypothetical protein